MSLSVRGRGVSGQPPAELARTLVSPVVLFEQRPSSSRCLGGCSPRRQRPQTPMRIQKGARHESNLGPTGAGCLEGQQPQRHGCSKPWRSHQTFLGLARRGTGDQVPLQVTCCPSLHEDVWALWPTLGPQPQGALHDVYVAALMAGTPLAPYGI